MAAAPASPFILRVGMRACTGGLPLGLGFFGVGQRLRKARWAWVPMAISCSPGGAVWELRRAWWSGSFRPIFPGCGSGGSPKRLYEKLLQARWWIGRPPS